MRRALLCAGVVMLAASRVQAQQTADPELSQIVESVRAKGLPTDPIVAKVRRGVIMHAPPARIVAAAQAVAARLEQARDALAPHPTASDIAAGEDALSINGVTTQALATIRAASPSRPVAVPVGVFAQLVASGVTAARATDIVTTLVKRGATSVQLVSLGNDVNGDVARGARAENSLEVRLKRLTPLLAPPAPSAASTLTHAGTTPPAKP